MRSTACVAILAVLLIVGAEANTLRGLTTGRKLRQTVNYSYGTKWAIGAPCENYYSYKAVGGPSSSLQYPRKEGTKVGCPPPAPIFKYSYDPKRAPTGEGEKGDGGKRKLAQTLSL
jgi:hypothetical protein